MKREQIKELKGMISQAVADDRISTSCAIEIMNGIDAIFALHLDVPSDEEILKQAHKDYPYYDIGWNDITMKRQLWIECAKWMRDEIIKRNK